jgi:hypothetical protein
VRYEFHRDTRSPSDESSRDLISLIARVLGLCMRRDFDRVLARQVLALQLKTTSLSYDNVQTSTVVDFEPVH